MIAELFAVPFISEELDMDLDLLTNYVMSLREQFPEGVKKSNVGGWQSPDLLDISHEEMIKLSHEIIKYLNIHKKDLNIKKELTPIIDSVWVNLNLKGSINLPHVHANAHFSVVFYVKVETIQELGCLEITHPAKLSLDLCWADLLGSSETTAGSRLLIKPKPNDLYIFPAWIEHSVLPHKNNEPRISIAMNISYVTKEYEKARNENYQIVKRTI